MIAFVLGLLIFGWLATVMLAVQGRSSETVQIVERQPEKPVISTVLPRFDERQIPALGLK